MKTMNIHLKTVLAGIVLLALCTVPAVAGVSLLYYVGYGLYPYGAGDVTTTTPGTGLLANNVSGRALVQLIYAGADSLIGDGSNRVDLANAANGYVAGDDAVWQSAVIEAGVDGADEWGFSSTMFNYSDLAWVCSGFVFARGFQDDTPGSGDAFYDTPLEAMNTSSTMDGVFGQAFTIDAGPTAGVALDQRILTTTNIVRTVESNQWDLMSVPLNISPSNKFGIIATNAAIGSIVYFYDPAISNFSGGSKSSKGWAPAQSNRMVLPGESFFLKTPATTGHEISVSGTFPGGPVTNQVHARWSALGYPYPVDVAWTDTSLSSNLPTGTLVYFWNLGGQRYDIYRKGPPAKGGWGPASNHVIHPGDGFIVRQPLGSTPFIWSE
jgi:hypothetical protein